MVPCMEEVEQLLCALLQRVGPGPHPGLAGLQALLVVHAVCRLLTLLSYRVQGVLSGKTTVHYSVVFEFTAL